MKLKGGTLLGVWFMPDNVVDGMLEDFCIGIAPSECINEAKEYIEKCKK